MKQEQSIIKRVIAAQHNMNEADDLIRDYLPFIKSETAKAIGRIPVEGVDDELSIALMGFHEAIESYEEGKGAFLNLASVVIKRRIIDFRRHENQKKTCLSLEETIIDEKNCEIKQAEGEDSVVDRTALKWEISHFIKDLNQLGITVLEVADNCPKYEKVIISCKKVINYLIDKPERMESIVKTGKLPVMQIVENTSVKRKTLEKHRKYLVAIAVIYFRKYDCIIEHLSEVFNLEKGGK